MGVRFWLGKHIVHALVLQARRTADPLFLLAVEFPAPKNELVQKFQVYYLGNVPVAKPVGMCPLPSGTQLPHPGALSPTLGFLGFILLDCLICGISLPFTIHPIYLCASLVLRPACSSSEHVSVNTYHKTSAERGTEGDFLPPIPDPMEELWWVWEAGVWVAGDTRR